MLDKGQEPKRNPTDSGFRALGVAITLSIRPVVQRTISRVKKGHFMGSPQYYLVYIVVEHDMRSGLISLLPNV